MKDIFVILTISLISVNWKYVETRYIPGRSRFSPIQRDTGPLYGRGSKTLPTRSLPGERWPQQVYRYPGSNRIQKQQPHVSSSHPFLIPQSLGLRTIDSQLRTHQYVHTRDIPIHGRQVNSARTAHSQHKISVSIDNGDEQSLITFRNKAVRPTLTRPNLRPRIIRRPDSTPNWIENNSLRARGSFRDRGHVIKRRPLHNILIRTKSGKKIKISHSLRNTNIILNANSFTSRGNSISNSRSKSRSKSRSNSRSNSRSKSRSKTNAPDSNSVLEVKGTVQVNDVGADKQHVPSVQAVFSTVQSLANTALSSEATTRQTNKTLVHNPHVFVLNGSRNTNRTTSISGGFIKQKADTAKTIAHASNTADRPGRLSFTNATVDKSNATLGNISGTNSSASLTNNVQSHSTSSKEYLTTGAVISHAILNAGNKMAAVPSVSQSEVGKTGSMSRDKDHPESAIEDIDGIDVPDTPDYSDTDTGDK